jgi:tRNA threonylcarbamoyl adenosine modification protein YeaZ
VLVVVVDTSTPAVTAALVRVQAASAPAASALVEPTGGVPSAGVGLLAQRRTVDSKAHGELLAPGVAAVLSEAGAAPGDLTAIVAGLGPGPFTGLRVGLVTAAAMGQALSIPAYGVCSLDGIGALTKGIALAAIDARRKEIYWAVYDDGARMTEPAVGRPAAVAEDLDARGIAVTEAAGDGARLYAGVLHMPVRDDLWYPAPLALAEIAADRVRSGAPGETLTPLYLRRPDAAEPVPRT